MLATPLCALRHALIELDNNAVRVLEEARQYLLAGRLAVGDRVGLDRRNENRYPGGLELLDPFAQIVDPEGEVMYPDLVEFDCVARNFHRILRSTSVGTFTLGQQRVMLTPGTIRQS